MAKNQGKPHAVPTLHSIATAHARSNLLALMLHITLLYRVNSSARTLLDKANKLLHEVCERVRVCAHEVTPHAARITRHASHVTHHTSRITRHASHVTHHTSRAPGVIKMNHSPSFQQLFHEHAQEPTKTAAGTFKHYAPQTYDPKWELIW